MRSAVLWPPDTVAAIRPLAVPVDSFDVSSTWVYVKVSDGTAYYMFEGFWNFRDDYVNGSDPDDVSAVAVSGIPSCWKVNSDNVLMSNYKGTDTSSSAYRYSMGSKSSIWRIRDRVSGFVMNADHGSHMISFHRTTTKDCSGTSDAYGKYYYEHNQDGSGGWSASVTVKVLTVSYSGSGGSTLRHATGVDYAK